jgi:hypothetical protein
MVRNKYITPPPPYSWGEGVGPETRNIHHRIQNTETQIQITNEPLFLYDAWT